MQQLVFVVIGLRLESNTAAFIVAKFCPVVSEMVDLVNFYVYAFTIEAAFE